MATHFKAVILGSPGSGKGTIASRAIKSFRLSYFSCGDEVRGFIKKSQSDIAREARDRLSRGLLLDDQLIIKLTMDKLRTAEFTNASWLLDGYPRSLVQAQALAEEIELDCAINLNVTVPDQVIVERISQRQVHEPSGRTYHPEFKPPRRPGFDDVSGEPLNRRPDDHPDAVMQRLREYHTQQGPIIEFYRRSGILREFSGNRTDILWPQIKEVLISNFGLSDNSEAVSSAA